MILAYLVIAYAVAGFATGLAFAAVGVTRVQPAGVSLGARILIVPGAVVLWPYVLKRWLCADDTIRRDRP